MSTEDMKILIGILVSIIGSSGFWAFIQKFGEKKDAKTQLLLGLAHDRLRERCMFFICRGWISRDEYDDLDKYLYQPYKLSHGNGSGDRYMGEVTKLPRREPTFAKETCP